MDKSSSAPTTSFQYAGFWRRFTAYWVDFLIVFSISSIIQSFFGQGPFDIFKYQTLQELQKAQHQTPLLTVVSFGFYLLYNLIFLVNYEGATPGMRLMGIKVVKDSGEKVNYPVAIIRFLATFLSALSLCFFGLGYLWIAWDKKKQAWHDKIARTVVVKTDQHPQTALGVIIMILTILGFTIYMVLAMVKGAMLGINEVRTNKSLYTKTLIDEKMKKNEDKYKDKILTYAPSSCGLSLPIPKTTDTFEGKNRKWVYEEVPLDATNFYILDKDVFPIKELQGAFLGYKDGAARLQGESFSVAFPGLNIYCVDNTKKLTLDEYTSLALATKNYTVKKDKSVYWGEVLLNAVTLEGKTPEGQQIKEPAYLGVTPQGDKLLYIRIWAPEKTDPQKSQINEDVDVIINNLQYRKTDNSPVKGAQSVSLQRDLESLDSSIIMRAKRAN